MRQLTLLLSLTALLGLTSLACTSSTANASPNKEADAPTARANGKLTAGTKVLTAAIGKPAPSFALMSAKNEKKSLTDYQGKYVVLEWTNYDCPFEVAQYGAGRLQKLQKKMTDAGVVWLSINTGAEGKQGVFTGQALLDRIAKEQAVPTEYLRDPDGTVGKLYGAKTTPHIYLMSPEHVLLFAGGLDGQATTTISEVQMDGSFLEAAFDEVTAGKPVSNPTPTPYGCGVKYG